MINYYMFSRLKSAGKCTRLECMATTGGCARLDAIAARSRTRAAYLYVADAKPDGWRHGRQEKYSLTSSVNLTSIFGDMGSAWGYGDMGADAVIAYYSGGVLEMWMLVGEKSRARQILAAVTGGMGVMLEALDEARRRATPTAVAAAAGM